MRPGVGSQVADDLRAIHAARRSLGRAFRLGTRVSVPSIGWTTIQIVGLHADAVIEEVDVDDAATRGVLLAEVQREYPHAYVGFEGDEEPPEYVCWVPTPSGEREAGCATDSPGHALADAIHRIREAISPS